MKPLILFLSILLCIFDADAQRTCATVENSFTPGSTILHASPNANQRDTLADEVIIIPVVIHVIYKDAIHNISNAQVMSQLASLNRDFAAMNSDRVNIPSAFQSLAANTKIQFCLARVDPSGRPTKGIIRKYTSTSAFLVNDEMKHSSAGGDDAWDSRRYLNIWVCNLLGRNLGYATFPGGPADKDGIVIQYDVFGTTGTVRAPYNQGRTTTHETGHWLGLKHIWGDADCGSDDIGDTPPQKAYNTGCPVFPHSSTCNPNPNGDMFMNYMDFSDDACMNMFTIGQKSKMRSFFATGGIRNSFLNSNTCDSSLAEDGPLPVDPVEANIEVSVYPNPVVSFVSIEVKNKTAAGKVLNLYSATGNLVKTEILQQQLTRWNLNNLPAGIYFIRVGEGKNMLTKKIIKL